MKYEKWKGRKVVLFGWKQYYGFLPKETCMVVEETDTEVLLERKKIFFTERIWTFKYIDDTNVAPKQISGYAKLIN